MKKPIYCLALTCIVVGFTVPRGTPQAPPAREASLVLGQFADQSGQDKAIAEVQATFERYIDAWKHADVEALSKVYATDARVTGIWPDPTLQYPVQGWTEVRKELNRVFDFTKGMAIAYSPRHVEMYGNVAIMTTNWEWVDPASAQPGLKEHPSILHRRALLHQDGYAQGQATFVFFYRDHHWVLVHEHASVLPPDR